MLTESSYLLALLVYVSAGLLLVALSGRWLLTRRASVLRAVVLGLALALLLTPALPRPGMDTFAPALIVAVFQWFTAGPEAAEHAVRPLAAGLGLGAVLGLCYGLTLRFLARRARRD